MLTISYDIELIPGVLDFVLAISVNVTKVCAIISKVAEKLKNLGKLAAKAFNDT
jgi:hypothetical protein